MNPHAMKVPAPTQRDKIRVFLGSAKTVCLKRAVCVAKRTGLSLRLVESEALILGIVPLRYERNIGTLGLDGQRRLLGSRVLVIGLGGLGGHVVELLARLGVGEIVGVDGDAFDETNLNRQTLCDTKTLGKIKVQSARKRLRLLNPAVEFTGHQARWESIPVETFRNCRLAFDCLDSAASRLALAEHCGRIGIPLIHGAIAGWGGEVGVCLPGDRLMRDMYEKGKCPGAEKTLGNLPMTAMAAASLMVAAAVPILMSRPPYRGLRLFDLRDPSF